MHSSLQHFYLCPFVIFGLTLTRTLKLRLYVSTPIIYSNTPSAALRPTVCDADRVPRRGLDHLCQELERDQPRLLQLAAGHNLDGLHKAGSQSAARETLAAKTPLRHGERSPEFTLILDAMKRNPHLRFVCSPVRLPFLLGALQPARAAHAHPASGLFQGHGGRLGVRVAHHDHRDAAGRRTRHHGAARPLPLPLSRARRQPTVFAPGSRFLTSTL